MRIAYLVPKFPCLSETFVAGEVARVKAAGVDTVVYAFERPDRDDLAKLSVEVRQLGADTVYVDKLTSAAAVVRQPLRSLRLTGGNRSIHNAATAKPNASLRLARALAVSHDMARRGVTHVHAHWPYATQVAWLVHRSTGVPYSVSIHAHEVAHENGHFPDVFETLTFATFCNRGAMNYLLERLGPAAAERSHLVYHGVDLSRFYSVPIADTSGPLRIVSAGRLTRTKGFDRLLRGCAALRARGVDVELSILGRGVEEGRLRELAAALNLDRHLDMPGWVSHDEIRRRLAAAHVFALLADTNFHDGLPNVVLEAMATARPVVLSSLPAAGEAVSHGIEGFIVGDADDADQVAAELSRFAGDAALLTRMGQAARERAVRDHDADVQIEKLLELFRRQHKKAAA